MQSLSRFDRFIESRRAEATRRTYRQGIASLVGDPEAFIALAESNKAKAEDLLIDAIIRKRDHVKGASLISCLARTKSMLDFYEVHLNFKKIRQIAPKGSFVGLDRAPLKEEVRLLLEKSPLRERVAVLCMASGGLRVGAFEYLRVGHLRVLEGGVGVLKVYAGEPEEYSALISPEAVKAVRQYLREREEFAKETLSADSPFLRNLWDFAEANGVKRERAFVKGLSGSALQREVSRCWLRTGLRKNEHQQGKRKEFKSNHGFRKFAKSQMSRSGMSWEDSEVLLGHKLNYYKPTLEHLVEVYERAVPYLTISELEEVKKEKTELETGYKERSERLEGRLAIAELRNKQMEEDFAEFKDFMAAVKRRDELRRELGQLDNSTK